jgi:predicted glycosyltransferase
MYLKIIPDHRSLDNVLDNVFNNYYQHWPQRIIIDRGPVTTKGNFELIQKHFKHSFKCIVLLRDLMDVLSFVTCNGIQKIQMPFLIDTIVIIPMKKN